jgi:drug/metabolite transporter (DMT)-like permease
VPLHPTLRASFPLLFVLIWSSGFIIARYGMPYAEPMTFLLMRFVAGACALAAKAPGLEDRPGGPSAASRLPRWRLGGRS